LPPDVYTEVLNFVTRVSSSTTADEGLKEEARRLRGKMLLHRPPPDRAKIMAEAQSTIEERRKRDQRLAEKNGGALGSEGYKPPTSATGGHVQQSVEPMSDAVEEVAVGNPAEHNSTFVQSPLKPGNKYTVRQAPSGGFGVYEDGSPVILQRHPTSDAAWEAIDETITTPESEVA